MTKTKLMVGLGLAGLIAIAAGAGLAKAANPANGFITTPNTTLMFISQKGTKTVRFNLLTNFLGAGIDVTSVPSANTNYSSTILAQCSNGANTNQIVNGSNTFQNDDILWCGFGAYGTLVQGGVLIL